MRSKSILTTAELQLGADPELLIELDGAIVGSEKVLPSEGLIAHDYGPPDASNYRAGPVTLVRDGIQIEFNIPPSKCREYMVLSLRYAFTKLHAHLAAMQAEGKQFHVSFKQVVDVDPAEFASLTADSRQLGCKPTFNYFSPTITVEQRLASIGFDIGSYPIRSAGGHIHLGLPPHLMSERERLSPLLEVLLGNTAVLIDRDPRAAERRRVYGGAGEFRLPRHGFEYRTLSNFWLRSKQLVSLVTGLARMAVFVLDTGVSGGWPADKVLLDMVDLNAIEAAINGNDLALAKANFAAVRQFIKEHVPLVTTRHEEVSLNAANLKQFDSFIAGIDSGGIEKWFPDDPMTHWLNTYWQGGFESWLDKTMARVEATI